ncbi:MAG: hypothetical protein ACE5DI_01185 [Candidatus Micrarchaeia archaeon]
MKLEKTGSTLFAFLLFIIAVSPYNNVAAVISSTLMGFFIPGFIALKLLNVKTSGLEQTALSIVSSIALSTFAVYLFSLAFSYSAQTIALSHALLALPLVFLKVEPVPKKVFKEFKKHQKAIALAALSFAVVFFVLANSLWVQTPNGVASGGWNWSDFLVHHSIIQSVNEGNFPPQTPFFSGTPLVYHWFSDLHTAMLSKTTGLSAMQLVPLENSLYALLLSILTYLLALHLSKNKKLALIAALLVVFGGGFGYLKFFQDFASGGNPVELIAENSYDNNWSSNWGPFKIPSVLGAGLLAWRAMAAGLPLVVAAALLLFSGFPKDKSRLALAGVIAGASAPFHFYAPIAIGLLFATLLAANTLTTKKVKENAKNALWFAIPALVFGIHFAFTAFQRSADAGKITLNLWWESNASDPLSFVLFYAANFGVPFLLAIAAIILARKKDVSQKWVLAFWALTLFAIPNILSLSGISWDMNKFFSFMWIPTSILAASLLFKAHKAVLPVLLLSSVLSPLLVSAWFVYGAQNWVVQSPSQVKAAEWIEQNTQINDVFVTAATINEPTDLAGRLRIMTFPPYASNMGLDLSKREKDLEKIYCGKALQAREVMQKYNAKYVINDYRRENCAHEYENNEAFTKVFEHSRLRIYQLT